jgi:hypothetical protein
MQVISHQTVRLSRGAHHRPADGMCVMELASVLAGERFSDRPRSVCPVIGALLRAYNDAVDDDRRQDLIPYAARVVGSRAGDAIRRERAARCLAWADERAPGRQTWWRRLARRRGRRTPESCAIGVAHAIKRHTDETHAAVLRLVQELIAVGARDGSHSPTKLTACTLEAMLTTRASELPARLDRPSARLAHERDVTV